MSRQVVRVHFIDKSCKAFSIDQSTTSAALRDLVVDRISLKEDACFALFEKKDDWERCLEPDEKPADLQLQWEKEKAERKKSDSEPLFVFKKKIFLKEDDREMEDPIAKDLIYKQALHSVISSEYPVTIADATKLAGLQCQVVYGDHNSGVHNTAFLTPNIHDFVPKNLLSNRRPQEWAQSVLEVHESFIGKSGEDAKTEYLNIVKTWGYYGSTFYPPCKSVGKNFHSKVVIGVNYEGIRLLKPRTKQVVHEYFFTEILSWASSSGTFAFEVGSQNSSEKYTFETKQGSIIASTIQTYIDILVQMLRTTDEDDDDDDTSETVTSLSDA
mmetsp:Transcript_90118/g.135077  ORF Transcript_90118/g.135077 Transcript_90118/m.135077 type:complete len:328 (+) Transcript_90118:48-1031(+)|eukprot:CAMPEP_0117029024 /NCGR_PEP_ID=MMETSP0472-20121206/21053_1 /TAXON_ID=693140 ORGANISM="Tiarina fusus, Strain LIS" /NCGR_SAMPLE_ID=MMETSP0472 /ASSEMBLY_ACC=CAM_ASM_000603 /LENGTH=327 /DNA_ID=CAMNT_0004736677 /DNA_START=38 /DNA_END=1021 /DNA_ORIENTATION=-